MSTRPSRVHCCKVWCSVGHAFFLGPSARRNALGVQDPHQLVLAFGLVTFDVPARGDQFGERVMPVMLCMFFVLATYSFEHEIPHSIATLSCRLRHSYKGAAFGRQ